MKRDKWFRARAKDMYHECGQIEIDANALVSRGDGAGAYVQAWVWVPSRNEDNVRRETHANSSASH